MSRKAHAMLWLKATIMALLIVIAIQGLVMLAFPEEAETTYQAALHISNWTNRTLELDIYVFGSETAQLHIAALENEANVTITVTWQEVKETITFIHCMGDDVDGWCVYELSPGQWRSVILW